MSKIRGFKVVKGYEDKDISMPERSTKLSAGYDFRSAEDIEILPFKEEGKPVLVPTGIKAYIPYNEGLFLYNRSSNPIKKGLWLSNGVGVVDADYYGNRDNDGHIMFQFINISPFPVKIKKGDKIGQGIFMEYKMADNDVAEGERTGGMGSTN